MNKLTWLSKLYYDIGKQQTDFRLCGTWIEKEEKKFTKWRKYLSIQDNEKLVNRMNQREQLKNEIIFDFDEGTEEDYLNLISLLKKDNIKFYAYSTEEGRARQIHTFWNGLAGLKKRIREKIRENIISKYKCDINYKIDAHVIPLEFFEHWKTGKIKKLIDSIDGINELPKIDIEETKTITEKKEIISHSGLIIDNFLNNAKTFYNRHPYFYDKTGIWWVWDNNKWEISDEIDMERKLDKELGFYGQTIQTNIRKGNLTAMKWVGREKIPKVSPLKWIQFNNKAYSLKSKNIYNVTKEYFFTNPIPWDIGLTDETPIIDKLFEDWVGKENKLILYEIIAYCLYRDYPIHRIFFLLGDGCNGKTTYLQIISKFIGLNNICSTELDNIVGHNSSRFETMKMYKKLGCLMGETNLNAMNKTSMLKRLSGHDLIGYEMKGKQPFDDYSYAKLIIASNGLPVTNDTSDGFSRRCLTIDFPNKFSEGKDILSMIPDVEYNNLAKKCLNILIDLLKKCSFDKEGTIEERLKKYTMASNPLPIFIQTKCEVSTELYHRYGEFYNEYLQWLKKHKKRPVSKKEFSKLLNEENFEIRKTSKEGEIDYYVEGLKFFPNFPDFSKSAFNLNKIESNCTKVEIEEIREKQPKFTNNAKCFVENCQNRRTSFDSSGIPYCEEHWEEMAQK